MFVRMNSMSFMTFQGSEHHILVFSKVLLSLNAYVFQEEREASVQLLHIQNSHK